MKIPFLGGAYEGRSSNVSPETCINLFYESGQGDSLVSTPGASTLNSTYTSPVRGGIEYNGLAYFVIGNALVECTTAGAVTTRGTLNTFSGRVSMAHNGVRTGANQQIMIVDGTTGYIYDNTTSTLTEIADADMVSADTVVFLDGYFVFSQTSSDRFWITSQYDGTAIDSADFVTAEGDPDQIQALVADQRQLFVFGTKTTEVFYNSGDTDQVFKPFQGGHSQTGCAARFSACRFDNSVIWLSQNEKGNGQVVRLGEGFQPVVVSTPEVNYQISTYSTISDAFGYVYQDEGHEFYVLTFPTAKVTWAYDALTQQWHQRAHTIGGVFPNRERYSAHVCVGNTHLFGDYANGTIYKMAPTLGTISGTAIPRERRSPIISDEEKRVRIASLQLDMQVGIGSTNNDEDTKIWLSYSKDGGHTFSNEIERSIGDIGDYAHRVIWRRLGSGRNWVFRIRTWSPFRVVYKGLIARLHGEPQ